MYLLYAFLTILYLEITTVEINYLGLLHIIITFIANVFPHSICKEHNMHVY
jgi:hypothetical protein